jgi:hypothetical protein
VFKIDMEKSYDHVDWEFFEAKGFSIWQRRWIEGCPTSVNFSIFTNGKPRGKIKAIRGLGQGIHFLLFLLL